MVPQGIHDLLQSTLRLNYPASFLPMMFLVHPCIAGDRRTFASPQCQEIYGQIWSSGEDGTTCVGVRDCVGGIVGVDGTASMVV